MPSEVYKPTDEELELLKRWYAPNVTKEIPKERTNALRMNVADLNKPQPAEVEVEEEANDGTLSAQALEEITQQAQEQGYQEGLAKGKEEGLLQGHQEGYEQGLAQGVEEGIAQGLEQAQPQIEQRVALIDAMINKLQQPLSNQDKAVESSLLELALTLAKKIVHVEVTQSQAPIVQAVSEGVKVIGGDSPVNLTVNPSDLEVIDNLFGQQQANTRLTINSDPGLAIGDCFLETSHSSVSMNLEDRINQVFDDFYAKPAPGYEAVESSHESTASTEADVTLQEDVTAEQNNQDSLAATDDSLQNDGDSTLIDDEHD
ncbi:flagellar assembly protein FliH [Psychrobium sp. MM17-31]|uniref:flagellar assembly protein FliH n=1 Tax=Psychrobium sp. MM17-31 TaxID=2917758 RepID=UPI001EF48252|nr:flagellar assembly protein FliH [Psychrobium sp. MM17-31]MCG7530090.1 flagellar assembly protein FliH [Psychrobium sp. MM17-31]